MGKDTPPLRVLHTSDWHLGRTLFNQKRHLEFKKFLDWLAMTIEAEHVNVLLVAGDIFDTTTPSNEVQKIYNSFLARFANHPFCRHIIVIGGNHDSPTLLAAQKPLLEALNMRMVGDMPENPEDEVFLLRDAGGSPELIVCAVPFLRDRDVRISEAGETADDKVRNLQEGIRAHYAAVADIAEKMRAGCGKDVPVVAMGHLLTGGGQCSLAEGERNLYIGADSQVSASIFSSSFDYVALGHIHTHYRINKSETVRYCGAPLPMGFDKKKIQKSVNLVEFHGRAASVREICVPTFQQLESIRGDRNTIVARVKELVNANSDAWLELVYDSGTPMGTLFTEITELVKDSNLKVLRFANEHRHIGIMEQEQEGEDLSDLTEDQVFLRLLDGRPAPLPEDEREDLLAMFREIAMQVEHLDSRAE